VCRYNWNWGNFIERSRNKFEQKLFRFLEKTVLNNSDIIFVGTETLKKNVEKIVHGKAKIIILPNWIDCDIFRQLNLKKKFDIISIGRLCPQKNHLLLLEAVNLYNIENQGNSLKILIIGKGELKVPLLRYAQEKNINLTLMEVVANDEMPYILNGAVISVMPSRYEGHPKAILEAMACGIAVVCTNVEGLRDIITDGENGLLCKEDAYDLKNKFSFLLKNEDYRRKLGTKGIEYIRSHCSMHHILTVIKNELSS
jgi:glycosyltransferase involved in cell wall biosynthesis